MFSCLLFGRGRGPAQTANNNTPPPKTAKKKNAWRARDAVFFCCLGWGVAGGGWFYCLGGRGRGRVFFFFAVWAGGVFILLLFGRVSFFLLFGRRTGVHSLTGQPGSALRGPTTKKTKQQKTHELRLSNPETFYITEPHQIPLCSPYLSRI